MSRTPSSGFVPRKVPTGLLLALCLASCRQPDEGALLSRPPASYGERPGQERAGVAPRADAGGVKRLEAAAFGDGGRKLDHAVCEALPEKDASLREDVVADLEAASPGETPQDFGEVHRVGLVQGGVVLHDLQLSDKGKFYVEGGAFLPFYDSPRGKAFGQLSARGMEGTGLKGGTRWVGAFGVGQRRRPFVQGEESEGSEEGLMLGYNAFVDVDFSRLHLRGVVGVEARYSWLYMASNYYFPLSGRKNIGGTPDFRYEERAAAGVDLRLKGYVPFYRTIAVTGSYGQWFGSHAQGSPTQDPASWSYGIEYTPFPLLTGYVRQERMDGVKDAMDVGIKILYRSGIGWREQFSNVKAAELTKTAPNAFVERENRIIAEQWMRNRKTGREEEFFLSPDESV